MCRVKAIASSVERLLRYANCSGSSEAGSTEQMCSLTSFSKHLLKMGVRATGLQSFKHVILFFFGMGTMVDFLKHEGTTDRERDRLKTSVKTPATHLDLCDVCFYIVYQQYTFLYCSDQLAE